MNKHEGEVTSYFVNLGATGDTVSILCQYPHHACQEPVDWEFWLTPEALEERCLVFVNAAGLYFICYRDNAGIIEEEISK